MIDEYLRRFLSNLAIGAPLCLPLMTGCLKPNSNPDGIDVHTPVLAASQPQSVTNEPINTELRGTIQKEPAAKDASRLNREPEIGPRDSDVESLSPEAAQRIVLTHEAPPVLTGTQVEHSFRFTNPTTSTLTFVGKKAMQVSCGCTHADVKTIKLEPDGQGELQLAIDTTGKAGAISESVVALWGNDADDLLAVSCSLTTVVQSAIDTVPNELVFDRESIEKSRSVTIHIRSDRNLKWGAADCSVTEPFVQIRDRDFDADRKLLTLKLKCSPVTTGSSRQAQLRIRIPDDQGKLHTKLVPIFAADTTQLRATPPILIFRETLNRPNEPRSLIDNAQHRAATMLDDTKAPHGHAPDAARAATAAPQEGVVAAKLIITGQAVVEGERVERVDSTLAKLEWNAQPLGNKAIKLDLQLPVDVLHAAPSNHRKESVSPRISIHMSQGSELTVPVSLNE